MLPVRTAMSTFALGFAALGVALVFAPEEAAARLIPGPADTGLLQVFGAALLGFAAMCWTARGAILGGIYGRAIVAANQTHLTVGAILLLKRGVEEMSPHPAYWAVAAFYGLGAVYFTHLTFFSSGSSSRP